MANHRAERFGGDYRALPRPGRYGKRGFLVLAHQPQAYFRAVGRSDHSRTHALRYAACREADPSRFGRFRSERAGLTPEDKGGGAFARRFIRDRNPEDYGNNLSTAC
jgi:hypothetical protein